MSLLTPSVNQNRSLFSPAPAKSSLFAFSKNEVGGALAFSKNEVGGALASSGSSSGSCGCSVNTIA